ncbi:efflux transporter, RND family, outer membrane lipoprotein subunit [Colwellia psychrerythraea 34H]|uniref:Efflux transporter, RND family, outer membrane lipoprotein subunit n=1 Tax=Colwellia psychrerythraea (strain 34H / ATCC BAA-681) TaxID=167879 RepID=Q482B4_COLP3|nr:efflux transporter, RND family, outer membrane lipoprotein subunit [Colwellia psychrerythraea 34H]
MLHLTRISFPIKSLFLLLSLSLPSCAVYQGAELTEHPVEKLSNNVEDATPNTVIKSPRNKDWWTNFNEPQLTYWVETSFKNNPSLQATFSRLNQTQAKLNIVKASNNPDLNLSLSSKVKRNKNLNTTQNDNYQVVGLSASWEIDLWGKLNAGEDKALWENSASKNDISIKANLIAANVSSAWVGWMVETEKIKLLTQQSKRTEQGLKIIQRRVALGKTGRSDAWQQQGLLESLTTLTNKAIAKSALQKQKLALWSGTLANQLPKSPQGKLPTLLSIPVSGIELKALKYRPDIQKSYAKLQAADAEVAIAVAEQFPQLTLRASYSSTNQNAKSIFSDWLGDLSAGLIMPIIDYGQRKQTVKQKKYNLKALQYDYLQKWQQAIFEVEEALIIANEYQQITISLALQLELAKKIQQLKKRYYLNGQAQYLQLLQAQDSTLKLERQLIDSKHAQLESRLSLYSAISHGDFISLEQKEGSSHHD